MTVRYDDAIGSIGGSGRSEFRGGRVERRWRVASDLTDNSFEK